MPNLSETRKSVITKPLNERIEEKDIDSIQISDMYKPYVYELYHDISFLDNDIITLNVADNESSAYDDVLCNIIYANLCMK